MGILLEPQTFRHTTACPVISIDSSQPFLGVAERLLCVRTALCQMGRAPVADVLGSHRLCICSYVRRHVCRICRGRGFGTVCGAVPAHHAHHRLGVARTAGSLLVESFIEATTVRKEPLAERLYLAFCFLRYNIL